MWAKRVPSFGKCWPVLSIIKWLGKRYAFGKAVSLLKVEKERNHFNFNLDFYESKKVIGSGEEGETP